MALNLPCLFLLLNIHVHDLWTEAAINLLFTSTNCETGVIRPDTKNGSFILTWNGQVTPNLCDYTFTGETVDLCFQSLFYNLPFTTIDIKVKITNQTKSQWVYDRFDRSIPRICVSKPTNLTVAVEVGNGYIEPSPITYMQLQITAKARSTNNESNDSGGGLSAGAIVGIVFGIAFVFFVLSNGHKKGAAPRRANPQSSRPMNTQQEQNSLAIAQVQPEASGASSNSAPPPSYDRIAGNKTSIDPRVPPPSYEEATTKREMFPESAYMSPGQTLLTPTMPDS